MEETTIPIITIASVCHDANRAWCLMHGDQSQKLWDEAEQWQRDSAIKGVEFKLNNPDAKDDAQHNAWMADKVNDGWVYGEVKDAEAKIYTPVLCRLNSYQNFNRKKINYFALLLML